MDGPKNLEFYLEAFRGLSLPIRAHSRRDILRESRVFEQYLCSLDRYWIDMLVDQADRLPDMVADTRIVLFVPARMEERRLRRCLDAILAESRLLTLQSGRILQLSILNNWYSDESTDMTKSVVDHWINVKEPPFSVCYVELEWQPTDAALSQSRKFLCDLSILQAHRRKSATGPLYFLSEDADIENIYTNRTMAMINYMDRNPHVDAVRGVQERTRKALAENQLILLERRSWFFAETLLSSEKYRPERRQNANFHWNRIVTAGSNVCFSAEVYCLVQGYSQDVEIFEDMDIGQRISVIRGRWNEHTFVPGTHTIKRFGYREESSASRVILSLAEEKHLYDHGVSSDFFRRADETAIRSAPIQDLLACIFEFRVISNRNKYRFERVLQELYCEILRIMTDEAEAVEIFKRVMFQLGFSESSFQLDNSGLNIVEFEQFRCLASRFSESVSRKRNAKYAL